MDFDKLEKSVEKEVLSEAAKTVANYKDTTLGQAININDPDHPALMASTQTYKYEWDDGETSMMSSTDTWTMQHRNKYKRPYYANVDHQGDHDPEDFDVDFSTQSYPSYINTTNSFSAGDVDGNRIRDFNRWTLPPEWTFDDNNHFDNATLLTGSIQKWYKSRVKKDRDKQYLANDDKEYNI